LRHRRRHDRIGLFETGHDRVVNNLIDVPYRPRSPALNSRAEPSNSKSSSTTLDNSDK
jgi:hypothetical protein